MTARARVWTVAAARSATFVLFGVFAVLLMFVCAVSVVAAGKHGSDFGTFWASGRAVLHGHSPYPSLASLPREADRLFAPFVYPPAAAFAMVPLSVLPFPLASFVFFLLDVGAIALALRLLGVSDWRCYGTAYASAPVFAAAGLGTISPLLLLGVAAAWRYRDRAAAAGVAVACVITAKLFLWPVWFWLVRTRRYRAAAIAAVTTAVAVGASWAAIGFAGLRDYPQLLGRLTELTGINSYSVYALARALGADAGPAQAALTIAGVAAVLAAAFLVRSDRRMLICTVAISLLVTPILWPHYLVLLFVPIALARQSFSRLWLAPVCLWLDATAWSYGSALRIASLLAMLTGVVGLSFSRRTPTLGVAPIALPATALESTT